MMRNMSAGGILGAMSGNWWTLVLRGAAAVLFGLSALIWSGPTIITLALVFGVYALVDAVLLGYAAYRVGPGARTPFVIQAVLSAAMGLIALFWPVVAVIALVFVIGVWAVVTGIAEITTAVRLRSQNSSEWLLIFAGALSVVFGLLLWFWPLAGAWAVMYVVGVYALIFGVVMVVAGIRLRGAVAEAAAVAPADAPEASEGPVSAFDEGYAEGYREGYRGDPGTGEQPSGRDGGDSGAAHRTGGRHRAPDEGDDPGAAE